MKKATLLGTAVLAASVITSQQYVQAEDVTADNTANSATTTTTTASTAADVSAKLTEAESNLTAAKSEQESAQSTYNSAAQNKQEADQKVSDLQEKVEVATNAQQIVAAQDEIINSSNDSLKTDQSELDDASAKLEKAEKAPDELVTELKSVEQNVIDSQSQLDQAKSDLAAIPSTVNDSNVAQVTSITDQMRSLKTQIDDALSSVSNGTTLVDNGAMSATTKTNLNDYEYNSNNRKSNMEAVNYQGIRRVANVISKEDYDEFVKTGVFKYKVDNAALSAEFIKLLNELRQLNGVSGNVQLDEAFLKYAEARANEVASKNKISHISTDPNVKALSPGFGIVENLNSGSSYKAIHSDEGGQHIINFDEIMTHRALAYRVMQGWYSDFFNIKLGYGHRRALFTMQGDKLGLAINTITNDEGKESYYIAMEGQAYEDSNKAERKEFWRYYDSFNESDMSNPTLLGKKMLFLPEYHFMYVVGSADSNKVEKLNDLMSQKDALEKQLVDLIGSTLDLNVKSYDRTTLSAKVKSLTESISSLKSRQIELQKEVGAAQAEYNALTEKVTQLKEKVNAAKTTLENATAKKSESLILASQLDSLKSQLSEAVKSQQIANDTLSVVSKSLDSSKSKLDEAQKNYDSAKTLYDLYQAYNVNVNDDVTTAVPKVAPTADSKPEYSADTESKETTKDETKQSEVVDNTSKETTKDETKQSEVVDNTTKETTEDESKQSEVVDNTSKETAKEKTKETTKDKTKQSEVVDNTSKETTKDETKQSEVVDNTSKEPVKEVGKKLDTAAATSAQVKKDNSADTEKHSDPLPETGTSNGILAMVIGQVLTITGLAALKFKRR